MSSEATTFRDLEVGQTFDFIGEDPRMVSFWHRCRKLDGRRYLDEDGVTHTVGSVHVRVYHVGPKPSEWERGE